MKHKFILKMHWKIMTRIVFTSILSLVTLGEFFNNKYDYAIKAVQPASVDDYCNSQDSESDSSSDGEGKVITITFSSCFANDLQYTLFER